LDKIVEIAHKAKRRSETLPDRGQGPTGPRKEGKSQHTWVN